MIYLDETNHIETLYTCALSGVLKDFTAKSALDELRRLAFELADRAHFAEDRLEFLIQGFSELVIKSAGGEMRSAAGRRKGMIVLDGGKHDRT